MIETLKASGRENLFTTWTGYGKSDECTTGIGLANDTLKYNYLMSLTTTIVLGTGAMRVMDGQMSMLVAFLYLMNNFMGPVNQLVSVGRLLQETEGDMGRIDDVLNYEISDEFEKKEPNKEVIQNNGSLNKLTGHFDMRNVTFGYNTTMPALIKDFNLSLKPGSRVALVGGSGKKP